MLDGAQFVVNRVQKDGARLKGYIAKRIPRTEDIDDIYQEVMARLIANAKTIEQPVSYAFRIADHLISDHYLSKHSRTETLPDEMVSAQPDPENIAMFRQKLEAFKELLTQMPMTRREVFIRRRVHGESCRSIAASLGVSVKAVEKHITKALLDLHAVRKEIQSGAGKPD